jgi:membrane-associated phospholipid phosphatase
MYSLIPFLLFRVFLGRHHVLDVVGGVVLALVEYLVMKTIWLNQESAESWGRYMSLSEDPWSSA